MYTSGRGSSAVGLTASVIKDSRGGSCLEGEAMVLKEDCGLCDPCDRDESRDGSIAKHVMNIHINASGSTVAYKRGISASQQWRSV